MYLEYMKKLELSFCDLLFETHFAVLEMKEDRSVDIETAELITEALERYYKVEPFVLITYRKFHQPIDLNVYKGRILKNMIGFAIVSDNPEERRRAVAEQALWNNAFTFFTDLEEAKSWAESFFIS